MNDLFQDTCPCCGRPVERKEAGRFEDFWNRVPAKIGKATALKAFNRLTPQDQVEAIAKCKPFYAWFKRTYPTASPVHPTTYLNQKRWLDEVLSTETVASEADVDAATAERIRSGKVYLCTGISAAKANILIASGKVTLEQCRTAGVL